MTPDKPDGDQSWYQRLHPTEGYAFWIVINIVIGVATALLGKTVLGATGLVLGGFILLGGIHAYTRRKTWLLRLVFGTTAIGAAACAFYFIPNTLDRFGHYVAAAAAAAIVGLVYWGIQGRLETQAVGRAIASFKKAFEQEAPYKIGFSKDVLEFSADGSGHHSREYNELKAQSRFPRLYRPYRMRMRCPEVDIGNLECESLVDHTHVEWATDIRTEDQDMFADRRATLCISGPLEEGGGEGDRGEYFRMVLPFTKGICRTREERKELIDSLDLDAPVRERSAVGIRAPTEELEAVVKFPPEYTGILDQIDIQPIVVYDWTDTEDEEEIKNVKDAFSVCDPRTDRECERPIGRLVVSGEESPKPWLMYGISWRPPSEEVWNQVTA